MFSVFWCLHRVRRLSALLCCRRNTRKSSDPSTAMVMVSTRRVALPLIINQCIADMTRASDMFPNAADPNAKAKEVRSWLATKGVRDFEPVSLFCDQLKKVWPKLFRLPYLLYLTHCQLLAEHGRRNRSTGRYVQRQPQIRGGVQESSREEYPSTRRPKTYTRCLQAPEPAVRVG